MVLLYLIREYIHIIVFFKHIVKLKYYLGTAQMSLHPPFISTISFTHQFQTWVFQRYCAILCAHHMLNFFLSQPEDRKYITSGITSACPLSNLHCSAGTFIMIYPIHQYQLLLLPSIQFIYSPS